MFCAIAQSFWSVAERGTREPGGAKARTLQTVIVFASGRIVFRGGLRRIWWRDFDDGERTSLCWDLKKEKASAQCVDITLGTKKLNESEQSFEF